MKELLAKQDIRRRILDISYERKLSHLGSVLTAVDIIDDIFKVKKPDEKFVLSSGHAALALYVVLEKYGYGDAKRMFEHHGVHPDRCNQCHIDCSTGSLGQGLPIAVGMALGDKSKNVYCLISDGECAEGNIWEALRVAEEQKLTNLKIHANLNGWGAYREIDTEKLAKRLRDFNVDLTIHYTTVNQYPFLQDQAAHYYTMKEEDYYGAIKNK